MSKSLHELKAQFSLNNIQGYIIPSNDQFMSEYTPADARRLEFITNFSGSNGLAIIVEQGKSLFFTDGRYIEQAAKEINTDEFKIINIRLLNNMQWDQYFDPAFKIGFDPKLFTKLYLYYLKSLNLVAIQDNLVDKIWSNRPPKSSEKIYHYPITYSGEEATLKLSKLRVFLKQNDASAILLTAPDSVCWLFNIRSSDVEFTPILLSYALITLDRAIIFADPERLEVLTHQNFPEVEYAKEKLLEKFIHEVKGKIIIDGKLTSNWIEDILAAKSILKLDDPCQMWKACKNQVEINQAIHQHIADGVAVIEFLSNIENNHTEFELAAKLTALRARHKDYISDSFPVICGFQENSAIIHYAPSRDSSKLVNGVGILLLDSGGQYFGATTDITRTIILGEPTVKQKLHYTLVLKGHIALGSAIFPKSISGMHLDILARQYLWQNQLDYPYSTGHGVGNFLSVHEGPQAINLRSDIIFQEGMILSNEPGFYLPGEYGIRIENLMYVKALSEEFLHFQDLTLVPHCRAMIIEKMLTKQEKIYLKNYYQQINTLVRPLLSEHAKQWLDNEMKILL